ncbi:MAG: TRM11 family SAM-dependent methyltransferase [Propionibacteriaceae bacterium]
MSQSLVLLRPSANRVYAAEARRLAAAELAVLLGADGIEATDLAGVAYLRVSTDDLPLGALEDALGRLSAFFAAFALRDDGSLQPYPVGRPDRLDDDFVGIPKYAGKTNEQFTRLLLNVTLAAATTPSGHGPATVLDPLCGRGTTLSTAWTLGHSTYGVELDRAAVEAYATFLRTYLRRKRRKHTVEVNPLRREGKNLGVRLSATLGATRDDEVLDLEVVTGDTRDSAALWGKKRFDVVVADAPYGVVHGSSRSGGRARSAADLLAEAVPVWAGQLCPGGALGLSWNTYHLSREELSAVMGAAGLTPRHDGPWSRFGHRVDSSVYRDLLVATAPADRAADPAQPKISANQSRATARW